MGEPAEVTTFLAVTVSNKTLPTSGHPPQLNRLKISAYEIRLRVDRNGQVDAERCNLTRDRHSKVRSNDTLVVAGEDMLLALWLHPRLTRAQYRNGEWR